MNKPQLIICSKINGSRKSTLAKKTERIMGYPDVITKEIFERSNDLPIGSKY